jgi:hypothetical protein
MFTEISVVPTSEFRTFAMSEYVSITTKTSFQVIGHFERMMYYFLGPGEITVKLFLCLRHETIWGSGDLAPYILKLNTRKRLVVTVMV